MNELDEIRAFENLLQRARQTDVMHDDAEKLGDTIDALFQHNRLTAEQRQYIFDALIDQAHSDQFPTLPDEEV